jgi:hypothetical protein
MKSLKQLCEGAWGYEPDQNDGTLDLRYVIWGDICEAVYDKCKSYITVKKNTHDWDLASWSWEALGALEYFIDAFPICDGFSLGTEKEYDRYYYWYRMIDNTGKDIFSLYEKCLTICENCDKWIKDWHDPEAMRQSLEHRRAILETWKSLYSEYVAHERILKQKMDLKGTISISDL